ncbi:MAG: hypothetical protein EBU46_17125 [Nitrosomonadaceae bacterium]|nr:hypothetical protein [Nitrosomonadaceae bacterium]
MEILEIIKDLQASGVTIKTDGKFLELEPPEKITNELIERLRKHKPAIIEELKREQRREKVLKMLEERPQIQRVFVTDTESDRHSVILTLGIRGAGTCEIEIPKHKHDPFLLLAIIERTAVQ